MRRRESGAELPGDLDRLFLRKVANPAQEGRQVLAVDVLHRQEMLPVDFAGVVNPADVGVGDLARGPHLVEEALETLGLRVESWRQELEGDRLPELEVVGPVDFPHAPPPQQADDAVAAGEHDARKEPRFRRAGGG